MMERLNQVQNWSRRQEFEASHHHEVRRDFGKHKLCFSSSSASPEVLDSGTSSSRLAGKVVSYSQVLSTQFDSNMPPKRLQTQSSSSFSIGSQSLCGSKDTQSYLETQTDTPLHFKKSSQIDAEEGSQVVEVQSTSDSDTQKQNEYKRRASQRYVRSPSPIGSQAILNEPTCSDIEVKQTRQLVAELTSLMDKDQDLPQSARSLKVPSIKGQSKEPSEAARGWLSLHEHKILGYLITKLEMCHDTMLLFKGLLFWVRGERPLASDTQSTLKDMAGWHQSLFKKHPKVPKRAVRSAYSIETSAVMFFANHIEEYGPKTADKFLQSFEYNKSQVTRMKSTAEGITGKDYGPKFRIALVCDAIKMIAFGIPNLTDFKRNRLDRTLLALTNYDFWPFRQDPMSASFGIAAFVLGIEDPDVCSLFGKVREKIFKKNPEKKSTAADLSKWSSAVKQVLLDMKTLYNTDPKYFMDEITTINSLLTCHSTANGCHEASKSSTVSSQNSSCTVSN